MAIRASETSGPQLLFDPSEGCFSSLHRAACHDNLGPHTRDVEGRPVPDSWCGEVRRHCKGAKSRSMCVKPCVKACFKGHNDQQGVLITFSYECVKNLSTVVMLRFQVSANKTYYGVCELVFTTFYQFRPRKNGSSYG